jgi:hypothetical protein
MHCYIAAKKENNTMAFFEQLTESKKIGVVAKNTNRTSIGVKGRNCYAYITQGDLAVFLHRPGSYIVGRFEQETTFKTKRNMVITTETAGGSHYGGVRIQSSRKTVNVACKGLKFKILGVYSYGRFSKDIVIPEINAEIYVCDMEMRALIEKASKE